MIGAETAVSRGSMTLFMKFVITGLMSLVILIALAWISWIIRDRADYRQAAVQSISESYASGQRLVGPVLVQPYVETVAVTPGATGSGTKEVAGRYFVFPTQMQVQATMAPSERHHGLYKVSVYELHAVIRSSITQPELNSGDSPVWRAVPRAGRVGCAWDRRDTTIAREWR